MARSAENPDGAVHVEAGKGASKRSRQQLHRMEIERAKNGGFVARHTFRAQGEGHGYKEPETHALADKKALAAHVAKHFGGEADNIVWGD